MRSCIIWFAAHGSSESLIQETVWLGDTPVATLRPDPNGGVDVYYVHTDQLNTPRRITRPSDNVVVWQWSSDPYGNGFVDEDPEGSGQLFVYNLRFPGQYYDSETGFVYNYYRDYDPLLGRYVESDPIGLQGGSYSTYAYSGNNPVSSIDPTGLVHWDGVYNYTAGGASKLGVGAAAVGFTFILKSKCVDGKKALVEVNALAGSAGTGLSIFGPASIGASGVSLEDNLSTLDPYVFNGGFAYSNLGTFFASITSFKLGGATGDASGWNASTSAFDASQGKGTSRVTKVRLENCPCGANQ